MTSLVAKALNDLCASLLTAGDQNLLESFVEDYFFEPNTTQEDESLPLSSKNMQFNNE